MLTERFDILFRMLSAAFVSHDNTPRTVETVVGLAQARARLEDARQAIRVERRHILQSSSSRIINEDLATKMSPVFSLNHER